MITAMQMFIKHLEYLKRHDLKAAPDELLNFIEKWSFLDLERKQIQDAYYWSMLQFDNSAEIINPKSKEQYYEETYQTGTDKKI